MDTVKLADALLRLRWHASGDARVAKINATTFRILRRLAGLHRRHRSFFRLNGAEYQLTRGYVIARADGTWISAT